MSLAQVLSTYVNMNLLIVIGLVGLGLFSIVTKKIKMSMDARLELKLHYGLLMMILALTAIHPFLPRNEIFSPAAKV